MPPSQRRLDRGERAADEALRRLASELRIARINAGLSQATLARAAGISATQLSRLERSRVRGASVRVFVILFALLGHSLSQRAYPEGAPIRDLAHTQLIRRFKATLPPSVRLRTEVPLGRSGDLRAWDGELLLLDGRCKLEAEMVLADIQALDRRIGLKMADDGVRVVVLVVADTRRNRAALRASRDLLAARFPLETRAVMRALRAGRCPPASGIVVT